MKIGSFDTGKDVLVVAEVGNNHEGSYALAEELVGLAAHAGAGAVKFQTIVPDRLVSPSQPERIRQLGRFRLSYEDFERLHRVAKQENILFLSTPFDMESARFLEPLVPAYKIASGDNNFYPMIDQIARTAKPILLSAGFTDLQQIVRTRDFIRRIWQENGTEQELAVLHCVVSYPTLPGDANLCVIRTLQGLGVTVGYSDHTIGIEAAVLSVAMGARIIEKHFTIAKDRSDFRDHQLSADPQDLARLVTRVREAAELLGSGDKRVQENELPAMRNMRRSIAAGKDLAQGTRLAWDDLAWLRPSGGLEPGREQEILNRVLIRSLARGEQIRIEDVRDAGESRS